MQSANVDTSVRSPYVNFVSELIDRKMLEEDSTLNPVCSCICDRPPSDNLKHKDQLGNGEIVLNKKIIEYQVLLENLHLLNSDCQSKILKFTRGFQSWITAKMQISDEGLKQSSIFALKELHISSFMSEPTEVLLRHVFKKLILNSNRNEIIDLLQSYRGEEEIVQKTQSNLIILAEKVFNFTSTAMGILAFPTALYVGYKIYTIASLSMEISNAEYLPVLVNKIINYAPLVIIQLGITIYEWKWTIIITSYVVRSTFLGTYSVIRVPVRIISEIAWLPIKLARLPFNIATYSFTKFKDLTMSLAHHIHQESGVIEAWRIKVEMDKAETLWVRQVMNLKANKEVVSALPLVPELTF